MDTITDLSNFEDLNCHIELIDSWQEQPITSDYTFRDTEGCIVYFSRGKKQIKKPYFNFQLKSILFYF